MTQALILLLTAFQLLTAVANNPSLPQSFKDNAILIANNAVSFAQTEIANENKVASTPIVVPNYQPIELSQPVLQITKRNMQDLTYKIISSPSDTDPSVSIQLEAKDENGKYIERPIIAITSTFNGTPLESVSTGDANYPYGFNENRDTGEKGVQYNPYTKEKGTYTYTFEAYGITKSVDITY